MAPNQKLLFDIATAADVLSLSQRKIAKLIIGGQLKAGWLGGRLLIHRSSLLKLANGIGL